MAHAYATTNLLTGLSTANLFPLAGPSDATLGYFSDARLDKQYAFTARANNNSIVVDFGSAKSVAGIAILNHNLAALDVPANLSILIAGADDNVFTVNVAVWQYAPLSTAQIAAPSNKDTVCQFAATSRRYWRVQFAWGGTKTLKIGELYFYGAPTTLTRVQNDGSGETERIISADIEMAYGETRSAFLAGPIRTKHFRGSDYSSSNRDELLTLWRTVKAGVSPFLWVETYEAPSNGSNLTYPDCIFGRLMLPEFAWTWSDYNLTQPPELVLRSLGREVGA